MVEGEASNVAIDRLGAFGTDDEGSVTSASL